MFTEIFLTLAAFAGLVIFYLEEIKALLRKIKGLLYLRSEDVRIKRKEKKKAAEISDELGDAKEFTLMESVSRLLQATLGFRGKKTAAGFIALSVAAGLAVFYLLRYKVTPLLAFAAGLSALSAPFLMLLCRLQSIRVENSKEGDVMITELLDNYKMNYFMLMGLIAGSNTDPPALAYSNQTAGNNAPAVGYSTVYPESMFLRILTAQLLILILAS